MSLVFAYAPYIWPSIISSLLMLVLAVFSFHNRDMPGAIPFAIACIFGLLWSIGSIIELTAVGIDLKIFWRKFQVVFQLPAATAITCFLLAYTWPKRWLTIRNLVLLWIVPIILAVIVFTDHLHHLLWEGFDLDGTLIANPGPLMKYFLIYVFLNFLLNIFVFIWLFIHSPQNRWPVVIMVIGQIMMRLLYFFDIANRGFSNLKFASVGIAFTSLMYAIVFFRFRILGPIPLARQAVINQMPIGMLVLDHKLKIVSLNPIAEKILQISSQKVKHKYIEDVLDAYPQNMVSESDIHQLEFNLKSGVNEQNFLLDILWLKDWRDDHVGQLLLLTDVTEQRKVQAKIFEQQRVLATMQEREQIARELHDDLAQVFAFIATQGQTIQRFLNRNNEEMADKHLERLIDAAREGEVDIRESIRGMRLTLSEQGLLATIEKYVRQFEANTTIHTDLITSDDFVINLINPMVEIQLLRILQEALTNIRKHAYASQVRIKFDVVDSTICISVHDNGRGFDFEENDHKGTYHFGLEMMRERAETVGGKIRMQSQPGQGTEIFVCVPINNKSVEV